MNRIEFIVFAVLGVISGGIGGRMGYGQLTPWSFRPKNLRIGIVISGLLMRVITTYRNGPEPVTLKYEKDSFSRKGVLSAKRTFAFTKRSSGCR